jgi:2-amino-4-hydroxy-6-hydroxymethyldihydropteridine diphosphokinase
MVPDFSVAYISLGSNLGSKRQNLCKAIDLLGSLPACRIKGISKYYKTFAEGKINQPNFLNAVIRINTHLPVNILLKKLHEIEHKIGRVRTKSRWEPRIIDLDILLYGNLLCNLPELTIPHPLLHKRIFVLEPLCEIAPDGMHPKLNKSIKTLLNELKYEKDNKHT